MQEEALVGRGDRRGERQTEKGETGPSFIRRHVNAYMRMYMRFYEGVIKKKDRTLRSLDRLTLWNCIMLAGASQLVISIMNYMKKNRAEIYLCESHQFNGKFYER